MKALNLPLKCGCKANDRSSFCPHCGKYQRNLFIGEPFPEEFDKSPLRLIAEKIYSDYRQQGRMAARIVTIPEGAEMWSDIREAIVSSDICFFNVTLSGNFEQKTFNPAFELGFSLGAPEGAKKYILAGSHGGIGSHSISFFNLKSVVPSQLDYFEAWTEYTNELNWDNVRCNEPIKTQLRSCEKRLSDAIFSSTISKNISHIYGSAKTTIKVPRERKTLFITSQDHVDNLRQCLVNIDTSGLTEYDIYNPDCFFSGCTSIKNFILHLNKELIKKYDYLIIHLRDQSDGTINQRAATIHNFKSAILAGYMLSKYETFTKESIYLLKPTDTSRTFSDYQGYNYDSAGMSPRIEEIIRNILL